ncbi:MAG: hypothetical protein DHS20C02_06620 [Micavibrio sp.]|nr:MAG: hypothetical protein DHS20C02_06620 [Micavibrio sp.]
MKNKQPNMPEPTSLADFNARRVPPEELLKEYSLSSDYGSISEEAIVKRQIIEQLPPGHATMRLHIGKW